MNHFGIRLGVLSLALNLLALPLHAQVVRTAVVAPVIPVVTPLLTGPQAALTLGQTTVLGTPSLSPTIQTPTAFTAQQHTFPSAALRSLTAAPAAKAGATAQATPVADAAALTLAGKLAASLTAATQSNQANAKGDQGTKDGGKGVEAAASTLFDGTQIKAEPKEWTWIVFLNGHNNLDQFGTLNMKQMEKVGSNDKVNLVVQWASLGKPTKRILVQRSSNGDVVTSPVIESLKPVDMGDHNQLYEFIRWSVEKFPAQKYFVDIWNHGSGWRANQRTANLEPLDVSYDDQTGNHITTEQVGEVMRRVKALIGRPVDVLGFDACLMAMAEVVAEVADSVKYFAGSEELEPGAGWPYDKVLQQWQKTANDDGRALLVALTEQFVAAYPRQVTFSGLDLSKFAAFAAAAKELAAEVAALDAGSLSALRKAAKETRRYGFSDYADFLHFVANATKGSVKLFTPAVVERATKALKELVVANAASADRAGSNGVAVWLPTDSGLWNSHGKRYLGLTWNKLTDWAVVAKKVAGVAVAEGKRAGRRIVRR